MTLITRSRTNGRIYQRRFDHDEMKRLRAEDPERWTHTALAEHFGVSTSRIKQLLDPKLMEKANKATLEYARRKRKPCLGGCGTLVWAHGRRARTGYCNSCLDEIEAERRADVREDELLCLKCQEWKPDSEFPRGRMRNGRRRGKYRRFKDTWCRSCNTAARRNFRKRHPEAHVAYEKRYSQVRSERRREMALYVVLKQDEQLSRQVGGQRVFVEIDEVEAVSPDAAIEKVADSEASYVAPPATRFEVVSVAPKTSLRVSRNK